MSKLRLRGSTSGFTEIQASAVAGDNTITLPATTGGSLIAADSSGNVNIDSGTLYVDATNNRVGIGVTGPQHLCQIAGTLAVDSYNDTSKTITLRPGFEANANGGMGLAAKDHSGTAPDGLGIYGTDGVSVHTANAGSFFERFRVDTSGRLLVGTSSDSQASTVVIQGSSGGSTEAGLLRICKGSTTPANGDWLGYVVFGDSGHSTASYVACARDGGTWTSGSSQPTRLVFSTTADGASSPTERMRITQAGALWAFTGSSGGFKFSTSQAASTDLDLLSGYYSASAVNTGTTAFVIRTNGNIQNANNSYGSLSDAKLKENIVDANSQWDDLKALQVRNYNFKEETGQQTHTQIGLIAQEVELVSPGLVSESPDRDEEGNDLETVTKSVNYSVLYMKAVKALQEAMERIEQLETEMAEVKAQLQVS
jgi:hypothetical protein